jgi:hypothetical protein
MHNTQAKGRKSNFCLYFSYIIVSEFRVFYLLCLLCALIIYITFILLLSLLNVVTNYMCIFCLICLQYQVSFDSHSKGQWISCPVWGLLYFISVLPSKNLETGLLNKRILLTVPFSPRTLHRETWKFNLSYIHTFKTLFQLWLLRFMYPPPFTWLTKHQSI